jgi:acetyl-CoA carboxylase carboxyltransferase component
MGISPDEDLTAYVHVAQVCKSLVRPTLSEFTEIKKVFGRVIVIGFAHTYSSHVCANLFHHQLAKNPRL